MRPYFAKFSNGTGFEPVLNWFQSTALTKKKSEEVLKHFLYIYIYLYVTANLRNQIFPGIPNPFKNPGNP